MNNCAMFNTDVDVKRNINEIGENFDFGKKFFPWN